MARRESTRGWCAGRVSEQAEINDRIIECLYNAVDHVNHASPGEIVLAKTPDSPLYGSSSALDSLGLVNFIVAAEQEIERSFGTSIVLADDRALAQDPSPFRSIGDLADYIRVLLKERE